MKTLIILKKPKNLTDTLKCMTFSKKTVFLLSFLLISVYLWNNFPKNPSNTTGNPSNTAKPVTKKTLNRKKTNTLHNTRKDRLKERSLDLQMEQNIQYQNTYKEHLNQEISPEEQHSPHQKKEAYFPEDHNRSAVVKDLNLLSLQEENYEDPENTIRRGLALQQQMARHLTEKNKKEHKEFIQNFVKQAEKQGFHVYFQENGKVLLQPIEDTED